MIQLSRWVACALALACFGSCSSDSNKAAGDGGADPGGDGGGGSSSPYNVISFYEEPPLPTLATPEIQRTEGSLTIGAPASGQALLDEITVSEGAIPGEEAQLAYAQLQGSTDYVTEMKFYEISSTREGFLGDYIQLTFPLSSGQLEVATPDSVGALYMSVDGAIEAPGVLDKDAGTVTVEVGHLSGFWSYSKSKQKQINALIRKKAQQKVDAVKSDLTNLVVARVDTIIKQLGERMGQDFDPALFSKVVARKNEIEALIKTSSGKKPEAIAEDVNVYVAKLLIDSVEEGSKVKMLQKLTGNPNLVKELGTAAGRAAGGDYYQAIEVAGKAIARQVPLTQKALKVVATYQKGIQMWEDHDFNCAYKAYRDGSRPGFLHLRDGVEARDWTGVTTVFGWAILKGMRKKYGKDLDQEELLTLAKAEFEQREVREQAMAAEEARLKQIYAAYDSEAFRNLRTAVRDRYVASHYGDMHDVPRNFQYFLDRINHIDAALKKIGIDVPTVRSDGRLDSTVTMLLGAFAHGGPSAYQEELRKVREAYAKKHGISLGLQADAGPPDAAPTDAGTSSDTASTDNAWWIVCRSFVDGSYNYGCLRYSGPGDDPEQTQFIDGATAQCLGAGYRQYYAQAHRGKSACQAWCSTQTGGGTSGSCR